MDRFSSSCRKSCLPTRSGCPEFQRTFTHTVTIPPSLTHVPVPENRPNHPLSATPQRKSSLGAIRSSEGDTENGRCAVVSRWLPVGGRREMIPVSPPASGNQRRYRPFVRNGTLWTNVVPSLTTITLSILIIGEYSMGMELISMRTVCFPGVIFSKK